MEERLVPYIRSTERASPSVMAALASAVLEWFLIFLLFLDASFSYLVTKFARYCNLQVPCLLCSRLDHILGKEKAGFYWDLICQKHKLKISSLVLCHLHSNLVDVHGMCESCLFSFATINKSNTETYRLLVGKFGAEPRLGLDRDPLLGGHRGDSSGSRSCSCCNEKWISRGFDTLLFQGKSVESKQAEPDVTLFVTVGDDRDDLRMVKDETYRAGKVSPTSMCNFEPLPHVEYKKVKITSDSESEGLVSDDESASLLHQYTKQDLASQCTLPDPQIINLADNSVSEKLIHPASVPEPSLEVKLEAADAQCTNTAAASVGHVTEECTRQQVDCKINVSASPELISFDEVLSSPRNATDPVDVSGESNAKEEAKQAIEEVQDCADFKVATQSISMSEEQLHSKPDTSETVSQMPNSLDLGDAYNIALGSRERQLSGKLLEQRSMKESRRASEDFKILLKQLSASRGIEISTDISPRVSGNIDEFRTSDASSSVGIKILQKRISLERNESGLSLDGSTVSEIEGESIVDRMKRQVEHDKKLMNVLYKELEEERNASAVAANQAMAMITRLQEEKASFHMEALQCLRMMEEQAEYDVEALQKANNLLTEKEKEIQDLGVELELYNKKFGSVPMLEDLEEVGAEDVNTSILSSSNSDKHDSTSKKSESTKSFEDKNVEGILIEFEGERLYLLQCLKKLDKKLQLFCFDERTSDIANGDFSTEQGISKRIAQQDGDMREDHMQESTIKCDGTPCAEKESSSTHNETEYAGKEVADWRPWKQVSRDTDFEVLINEFSLLRSRLEALETETRFLEHSFKSLKNGDEGIKCIEEIACYLRDLRSSIKE